ncbi:MAG TPA: hypothetical protein VK206_14345 [Anaerolineales bacterium]|nr:hypothetical protein [Anaerolineales bacterium]HLO31787.1 hypothetical protein [Anaerolineales bacterium]
MATKTNHRYHPTESKYKGGAQEVYVTYDLKQKTRAGDSKLYPKVKRVYIAGEVKDWKTGNVKKRTGKTVHGVAIEYEQSRKGFQRSGFSAQRDRTRYAVKPASVGRSAQRFRQVLEVPQTAQNVHFYSSARKLPARYQTALQNVR